MGVNGEALQLDAVYKKPYFFTTSYTRICISTASHARIRIRYCKGSHYIHLHCSTEVIDHVIFVVVLPGDSPCYRLWGQKAYFPRAEGKNSLVNCLLNFCSVLQSDCFMQMMSHTAIDGDQRRLGSWSAMQETKPGRTRERPAKECQDFSETGGMCFWAWKLAVWSSWAFKCL